MSTAAKPKSPVKTTRTVAKTAAPLSSTARKMPAPKAAMPEKIKPAKKPKLVRDSFTIPKDEYQAIDALKQRATGLQRTAKKSELLRAGLMALSAMNDKNLASILAKVPALKTGRPMKA
jgi:hypothetical protein